MFARVCLGEETRRRRTRLLWTVLALSSVIGGTAWSQVEDPDVFAVEPPQQLAEPPLIPALGATRDFIGLNRAQQAFATVPLDGRGLSVAILDTGIRATHEDFAGDGRIPVQVNLTLDNGGDRNDASDPVGHGSHIAGLIAANGIHQGVAPAARIIPIKVLHENEAAAALKPGFIPVEERIEKALQWVLNNADAHSITVVNISVSNQRALRKDNFGAGTARGRIRALVQQLYAKRIPVVVAAGNHYCRFNHAARRVPLEQGMGFPAIIRETISVGAVYAEDFESHLHVPYHPAEAHLIVPGQITPFTQRLDESVERFTRTDVFAPGGLLIESTGQLNDVAHSNYPHGGTSQAAPLVTGAVLLLQQFYKESTNGDLPDVSQIEDWLRSSRHEILDGDDEYDNVRHTCGRFVRLDIFDSLITAQAAVQERSTNPTP